MSLSDELQLAGAVNTILFAYLNERIGDIRVYYHPDEETGALRPSDEWYRVSPEDYQLDCDEDALVYRRKSDGLLVEIEAEANVYATRTIEEAALRRASTTQEAARQLRRLQEAAVTNGTTIFRDGKEPAWVTEALDGGAGTDTTKDDAQ